MFGLGNLRLSFWSLLFMVIMTQLLRDLFGMIWLLFLIMFIISRYVWSLMSALAFFLRMLLILLTLLIVLGKPLLQIFLFLEIIILGVIGKVLTNIGRVLGNFELFLNFSTTHVNFPDPGVLDHSLIIVRLAC